MFGIDDAIIGSIAGGLMNNMFANDRQSDAQQFSAAQAQSQTEFQERMSNTQYQRQVADLSAAGMNPMLAYMKGGATTPSGAMGSAGIASPGNNFDFPSAMATSSQIKTQTAQQQLTAAQQELTAAETDKAKAEADRIRAQTPTYAVDIERTKQQIQESIANVGKIIQETGTSAASAGNIHQQTENLKAQIPQIEAMIENLKAMSKSHAADIPLKAAQTVATKQEGNRAQISGMVEGTARYDEIRQRIDANLPAVEAALGKIKGQVQGGDITQAQGKGQVYQGPRGVILEFLRAINPLQGMFK